MRTPGSERGFSTIEMLTTLAILGVVAAIAMPVTTQTLADLRLRGDARALHNMVGLAKMRAASRFTRTRVYADLTNDSFRLQFWDKASASWVTEGGTTSLADGVDFSFGGITAPPPNTQSAIGQSAACTNNAGTAISNTACIVFNSRGIPVTSTGSPTGNSAFYVSDGTGTYAVTLSATPLIRLWWTPAAGAHWVHR